MERLQCQHHGNLSGKSELLSGEWEESAQMDGFTSIRIKEASDRKVR